MNIGAAHKKCLEIAPTFRNDQSRNILLQMAQVWLRLADDYEDANKMVGEMPRCGDQSAWLTMQS